MLNKVSSTHGTKKDIELHSEECTVLYVFKLRGSLYRMFVLQSVVDKAVEQ